MVLYYWDVFFTYPSPLCFLNHNVSRDGSALVRRWNLLCGVRSIDLEPLERCGLKNIRAIDKEKNRSQDFLSFPTKQYAHGIYSYNLCW
jgi:hypothetical protein